MFFDMLNQTNSNDNEYYDLLELPKTCSDKDIKKSYHKLAMKYHPDKNPNNKKESELKFRKISEAYDILSDSKKRKNYDQFGKQATNFNMDFDPLNMFNKMFSDFNMTDNLFNTNFNTTSNKIKHINIDLPLSLEDIHTGCSKNINYKLDLFCNYCNGTGSKLKNIQMCMNCNGSGNIATKQGIGLIQLQSFTICNICNGSGEYISIENRCQYCNGTKFINHNKSININIKSNIKYGEIIELKNKGNQYDDNIYSNLIIKIIEKPHKHYKRIDNSNHIFMDYSILLSESLLGFQKIITNLDGDKVLIQSPDNFIIKPNMILIANGLGINGGNLIIKFNIIFPSSINDIQRKYISKLLPVYKKNNNLQYSKSFNLHYNKNINIVEKTNNTNNTNNSKSNNILPDLEDSLPNCSQQ